MRHDVTVGDPNNFFEEDEPLAEVLRAYDSGEKGRTAPPTVGYTVNLDVPVGASGPRGWTRALEFFGLLGSLTDQPTTAR
jgi:hypothetical protein